MNKYERHPVMNPKIGAFEVEKRNHSEHKR